MKLADPDNAKSILPNESNPKSHTDLDRGADFPDGGADLFDDAPPALAPRLAA